MSKNNGGNYKETNTRSEGIRTDMEEIFDINGIAQYLKVEPKTIDYLVRMRRIPLFFVGRHIRFRREAVLEWAKINEYSPDKVIGKLQESENRRAKKSGNLPGRQVV